MSFITDINVSDLKRKIDRNEATLLDVREADEYNEFHIPNSVNVPLSSFDPDSIELAEGKGVVFICRSGMRSARAYLLFKESLGEHGCDIFNLRGGITAWVDAKYNVIKGSD